MLNCTRCDAYSKTMKIGQMCIAGSIPVSPIGTHTATIYLGIKVGILFLIV